MSRSVMLRDLSLRVASHPRIEKAVRTAIGAELPHVIEDILSEMYPGEEVKIYSPKKPTHTRRERDEAIRLEFNGSNVKLLAAKYSISASQVHRILQLR